MAVINLRTLSRETKDVVEKLEHDGEPVVVARRGEPVAVLLPATPERVADAGLAGSPDLRESLTRADAELAAGETQPLDEVLAELASDPQEESAVPAEWRTNYDRLMEQARPDVAESAAPHVPEEYTQQAQELDAKLLEGMVVSSLGLGLFQARLMSRRLVSLAGGAEDFSIERYRALVEGAVQGLTVQGRGIVSGAEESAKSKKSVESPAEVDAPEELA